MSNFVKSHLKHYFSIFFLLVLLPFILCGDDALSYGIETKNGEYIRKALLHMSDKECSDLFKTDLGEKVAFTYIQEACSHPLVLVRLEGLFGARNANNGASALLLEKALNDPHFVIRSYARKAAQGYFDSFIQQKLLEQATTKRGEEQLEAFFCLLSQNPDKALSVATSLFENQETPLVEKLAILEILSTSASSKQSEKYLLLTTKLSNPEPVLWLSSLNPTLIQENMVLNGLTSNSLSCKIAALEYLGMWGLDNEKKKEEIAACLLDFIRSSNILLKSKASWVALCHIPDLKDEAQCAIKSLSLSGDKEANLVASLLSRCGKTGLPLAKNLYKDLNVHPLVRLNSALQLIRYRTELEQAPFELLETLEIITRPLTWNEQNPGGAVLFETSEEDELRHQLAQYKDVSVRCSLIGLALNTSNSPEVEKISYKMAGEVLKKKAWGPLLEGGSELFFQVGPKSLALARKLTGSLYEEVRIQAAGILAAMNCQKEALTLLSQEFTTATFDGKMAILALLSPFTLEEASPFLTTAMKDKSMLLRTRAAGVFLFMKYTNHG